MSGSHDVLVVGGGHNGLTAAAYLSKAGLDVAVVEKKSYVGGGAVTLETNLPGFKHDVASAAHIFIQANPLIRGDELNLLSKHGLEYIGFDENPSVSVLFPDDSYVSLYRDLDKTCDSIAKFSSHDAEAYRKFALWTQPILEMLMQGFFSPPAPFGALFAQLDQPGPGQELIRALQMSSLDILDDWFENNCVKAALARFVSEIIVSPDDIGTGAFFFIMVPLLHTYGMAIPKGGSGALSESLARCIEANGGKIYLNSGVTGFNTSGGRIKGVEIETGETIKARQAVLADLNIKQIPELLNDGILDEEFLRHVKNVKKSVFVGFNQNLSLNEAPNFRAGDEVNRSCLVELADWLPGMCQTFDGYKYGKVDGSMPCCMAATVHDPSRAPEGKHTVYLFQYNPYDIESGPESWSTVREEVAETCQQHLRKHTTNMGPENILGNTIWSPADLESFNDAWIGGDPLHVRNMIAQFFSHRPFAGAGYYKMPVEGLYLCGPSTHPGGGVTGGARGAAMVVMEDLGLDFEKTLG